MKRRVALILTISIFLICSVYAITNMINTQGTNTIDLVEKQEGKKISISILEGEEYLHKLKINPLITIKTPPQFAIWIEDLDGNYIETLYATSKIVHQNWSKAPSDPTSKDKIKRKEALPYWTNKRGNNEIDANAVSGATPKTDSLIKAKISDKYNRYIILAEFNNSADFNKYYPRNSKPGDSNYSGGEWGSGQPAIVYAAVIDLNSRNNAYELKPIGHSSPDGKNGKLYKDISKLTTAKDIINKISVETD